jgi:hypothetical protein
MTPSWRIKPNGAEDGIVLMESQIGALQGRVDAHRPEFGLHEISFGGDAFPAWRLLAPQLADPQAPLTLAECYVRGDDLIVTYTEEREKLRREIYWRVLNAPPFRAAGVESIVSVQTSLLHSHPQLMMTSRLSSGEIGRLQRGDQFEFFAAAAGQWQCTRDDGPGVFMWRPSGAGISYVEMVHPSDFQHATLSAESDHTWIVHSLFPESLEKGVIRRGRVRGWFVHRDGDVNIASDLYQRWLSEPPPLTT